eukprot:Anaeramoba_ignava/c19273_g1_i1.p1 GENE.c19273_g1_i1~~c19273_g1_i1.p1  ORF type:complete len:154 (-),score=33.85 c19273_g1_i1:183-587(-)
MHPLLIFSRILVVFSTIFAFLGWVIPCLWQLNSKSYTGYSYRTTIYYCGNFQCTCSGPDCPTELTKFSDWKDIDLDVRNGLIISMILGGIGMVHIFLATSLFFKGSPYAQYAFSAGGLVTFIGLMSFIGLFQKK